MLVRDTAVLNLEINWYRARGAAVVPLPRVQRCCGGRAPEKCLSKFLSICSTRSVNARVQHVGDMLEQALEALMGVLIGRWHIHLILSAGSHTQIWGLPRSVTGTPGRLWRSRNRGLPAFQRPQYALLPSLWHRICIPILVAQSGCGPNIAWNIVPHRW